MNDVVSDYLNVINKYLGGEMPVDEFQITFIDTFKDELRRLPEPIFFPLDELFAWADGYTTDPELLDLKPNYYVNEQALRSKAQECALKLTDLLRNPGEH